VPPLNALNALTAIIYLLTTFVICAHQAGQDVLFAMTLLPVPCALIITT